MSIVAFNNFMPSTLQFAALTGIAIYNEFNPNYIFTMSIGFTGAVASLGLASRSFVSILNPNTNLRDLESGALVEIFNRKKDAVNLALHLMSTTVSVYQFYLGYKDAILVDQLYKDEMNQNAKFT